MSCSKMRGCKKKKRPFCPFPPISSAIPGFFKIMIGDFRDAMFIPPKFARTFGGMVNRNFYLEDSPGNCWMVKLREIDDGSLVFVEGWREFILNHSISVGEIVVFKHISIALFTVQIYGTSGCERVEFQGKENGYNLKRKRTKNEITPNILCRSKAQKSYETSKGNHNASVKESSKKDRVEKAFPCLAGNETAARKYVTRSAREHTCSLEESPPHDDGHRKLRKSSMMSHSEAPSKVIDQGKKIEESGRNSPIVLSDDDEEMDEVIMIKNYSYVDKFNNGVKSSAKVRFKNRKKNLAVDKRSANRCFLTTERKPSMMRKEVMEMTPNASVYPGTSQIKCNSRSTNISAANEGKMSVREKAIAVEHNDDRKEGVAACNKSQNRYLSALDKKNSVIDKISVCKQEVSEITPFTSAPPQILETKRSSQDANRLAVNEENTSHEHNSPKRPKTVSAEDCTKLETRIMIKNNCEIVAHPLADESLPMVGCSQGQYIAVEGRMANDKIIRNNRSEPEEFTNNLHDEEFVGNSYGRPEGATPEFAEDDDGNLVLKEFACNALVMGEGVCYTAVQDSENKLEANVDAPVGMHTEDEGQHLILAEEFAQNPLVNERMPMVDCSQGQNIAAEGQKANDKTIRNNGSELEEFTNNLDDEVFAGNSYGRPEGLTPEFVDGEAGNLVSKEFSCKCLVMGEGMCYDAAQDSKDKLEVNVDASIGLHAEDEGKNLILAEEFAQNCLVMGEGSCYPVDENYKDRLEERIDSYIDLGAEDGGGNLIVPKVVVSKSLVRGGDICYIADDFMDELETRIDASIDLHAAKGDCKVLDADEDEVITKRSSLHENNPELPSSAPLLNYNLPPPCMGIINCDQSEGNLGNVADSSHTTTVKRFPPLVMADVSDSPKDLTTMEGDPLPSGISPGEFPEMDAEKVDPCSKGEVLAVVQTEIMDSTDFPSLKNVKFSTSVSLVSQSWLRLPEKLPAHLLKKRCHRKVVLLQDPSMNLWPVLYHEGFNFIGFVGGWEIFFHRKQPSTR